MKDEIKKILDNVKECCEVMREENFVVYQRQGINKLLDYITNLQNENKNLKQINEEHRKLNGELREENKELLDETTKLTELWLKEKEKIRKVIEYLEAPNRDNFDYCKAYMIQILL